MENVSLKNSLLLLVIIIVAVFLSACVKRTAEIRKIDVTNHNVELREKLEHLKTSIANNPMKLDSSDYQTYDYEDWFKFHERHTEDVVVVWYDGQQTTGPKEHDEKLKTLFSHAPDTRIIESPLHVGWDNENAAYGVMTGTFTEPIILQSGKKIKPTKRTFSVPVYAISTQKDGVMVEKFFYWDHELYLSQLGI